MNRYVALLLLCWGSLIVGCAQRQEFKVPLAEQTKSQTVALVETVDGNTRVGCTAVWVNDDTMVTARHCVEGSAQAQFLARLPNDAERMAVLMLDELPDFADAELEGLPMHYIVESEVVGVGENPTKVHDATTLAVDKDHDIAIIQAVGKHPYHMSAAIVANVPTTGTDVEIVGHTKGLYWTFMHGTISGVRKTLPGVDGDGPYVQITSLINRGNSGGGAFDSHGCLVGIASFMYGAPGQSFFIHPETIRNALEANRVVYKVSR